MSARTKSPKELADEANKVFRTAIERAIQNADGFADDVIAAVGKRHMFSLVGIETSVWDSHGWRLRSWDASSSEPELTQRLKKTVRKAAEKLVEVIEKTDITLTAKEEASLRKYYRERYKDELERALRERAKELAVRQAAKDAAALIGIDETGDLLEQYTEGEDG